MPTKDTLTTAAAKDRGNPFYLSEELCHMAALVKDYVDSNLPGGPISTQGDLVVGDSSGEPARLPIGATPGQALVTDGTDPSWGEVGTDGIADGAVTLAKLGPDVASEATGTLTQADILAMNGAPVELIPAPGAGKLVIVDEIEVYHKYANAAYTAGGDVSVQYGNGTAIAELEDAVVTGAADSRHLVRPEAYASSSSSTVDLSGCVGEAVEITNASAAFDDGDADNVVKYRIRYRVITVLT